VAKVHEDATKPREEAAKAHEDLVLLLARTKELEVDVAQVSGQRHALNVQIGLASACVGSLMKEHRSRDRDAEGDRPRQERGSSGGPEDAQRAAGSDRGLADPC
jgi:hypothetical protein